MTASINSDAQKGKFCVEITGEAAIGLQGNILNPEGVALHIVNGYLYVETAATAAATLNIGVGASGADNDDLISAFDIQGATVGGVYKVIGTDLASEGAMTTPKGLAWAANSYLTLTSAAASAVGFAGKLYLEYLRLD